MHSTVTALAAAAALPAAVVALTPIQQSYERLLVWGASYLDNAHVDPKLYDARFSTAPDYEGRFGNGPVISEYIGLDLGLIANTTNADEDGEGSGWRFIDYAFAGAVVNNSYDPGRIVADIHQQFAQFEAFVANGTYPTNFTPAASTRRQKRHGQSSTHHTRDGLPATLALVEVGLNTMVDTFGWPLNTSDPAQMATRDANITSQVQSLGDALANLSSSALIHSMSPTNTLDILVFGQFPLDKIPNWSQNNVNLTELRREVDLWNQEINQTLANFNANAQGDRWLTWSAENFWESVIADPAAYNMTDAVHACVDYSTNKPCSSPSSYLFWDSVHLTTTAAAYLAKDLLSTAYVADAANSTSSSIDVELDLNLNLRRR